MKHPLFILCLLLFLSPGNSLFAQTDAETILKNNVYPVSKDFKGKGWSFILKEAKKADVFLLGEDHGFADISQAASRLFKSLSENQYQYLGIETGPLTASILLDAVEKKGMDQAKNIFTKFPFSVPFYSWKEEFELLKTVKQHSRAEVPIFGLDQELMGAPRLLLSRFQSQFSDPAFIKAELDKAQNQYELLIKEKNPRQIWMMQQTPESWSKLESLAQTEQAKLAVQELKESARIYGLYFQGKGLENNYLYRMI